MIEKTKAPDKNPSDNIDLHIATLYFRTLRKEVLAKIRAQIRLVYYKFLVVGGLLGVLLAASGPLTPLIQTYTIILPVLVAIAFDLSLYQNNRSIVRAGEFIQTEIEEKWFRQLLTDECRDKWILWEHHIAATGARRSYNWLEGTQYLLTVALTIFAIGTSYFRDPWVAFMLGGLLFSELALLWRSLFHSIRG